LAGELQLEDHDGNELEQQDYESAIFLGLSFIFVFRQQNTIMAGNQKSL